MGTATLFVRHHVADYAAWRSVYDAIDGLRQEHGCLADEVMLDPADANEVFVTHRFPSLGQAQAFAGSAGLKDAMGRAGVTGPPRIEIVVEA